MTSRDGNIGVSAPGVRAQDRAWAVQHGLADECPTGVEHLSKTGTVLGIGQCGSASEVAAIFIATEPTDSVPNDVPTTQG